MFAALLAATLAAPPEVPAPDVRDTVRKGLKWLADQQAKDGSWAGNGGMYPTSMTGFAGLALLCEGSTLQEGTYAPNLRLAVEWYEENAQPNGLLGNRQQTESARYILGHGFGLLFLASAHAADDDEPRRKRVRKLLDAAVAFAADSQTTKGGWGYVSGRDGADFDEGNSTVTMIQALFAARQAGVSVPRATLDKAAKYLVDSTNRDGGVIYSLANGIRPMGGDGRPTLTAGAAAGAVMSPDRKPEQLPGWVAFGGRNAALNLRANALDGNTLLHHFHLARVANALGETGHRTLDPAAKDADLLRWSAYRAAVFKQLAATQTAGGNWPDQFIGDVYSTSLALVILQLGNNYIVAFGK